MKRQILGLMALALAAGLTARCERETGDAGAKAAVAAVNKLMADSVVPLEAAGDGARAARIVRQVADTLETTFARFPQLTGEIKSAEIRSEMEKGGEEAAKFLTAVSNQVERYNKNVELRVAANRLFALTRK